MWEQQPHYKKKKDKTTQMNKKEWENCMKMMNVNKAKLPSIEENTDLVRCEKSCIIIALIK